jgi:hypothetical protein
MGGGSVAEERRRARHLATTNFVKPLSEVRLTSHDAVANPLRKVWVGAQDLAGVAKSLPAKPARFGHLLISAPALLGTRSCQKRNIFRICPPLGRDARFARKLDLLPVGCWSF